MILVEPGLGNRDGEWMKKMFWSLIMGAGLCVVCSCDKKPDGQGGVPWTEAEAMEKGKQIAAETFGTLSSQLLLAMGQGGPTNALQVCSRKAAELAGQIAAKHGVRVQRVSHRPRNPGNRASPEELTRIKAYQEDLQGKRPPQPAVASLEDGSKVFYGPILIQLPVCLECHGRPGDDIKPEALQVIEALYPEDEARGFGTNELRGLWKITFPPR